MADWATLGVPPPKDKTDRVETGRFVRAILIRTQAVVIPLWILVVLMGPPEWIVVVLAVSIGLAVLDIAWLSYRIRRDERRRTAS